ncbi:AraC family transcriptional regulator [Aquimarina sp. U1-2]|uniref:AraC family transcriptional regulator n=1 Tax=Aquimarina sp. U1-2 TaxID=2823141 RepID=UPI001AED07D9|nr:AraC family transcriptional regulator [Aquimarina sp. U1-2]MBP2833177.1 AraC family transcriptional regulator [Aquimarina sp. U1-2]
MSIATVFPCKYITHPVLFFSIAFVLFTQVRVLAFQSSFDSLQQRDYKYLKKYIYAFAKDSVKAIPYARYYLEKAKREQDTLEIVNGFYYFSGITKDEKISEKYVDSMLLFSKTIHTKVYPALAFFNKAKIEYNKGNFKQALDFYLKTNATAKALDNTHLFYASKKSIGILKSRIGEYDAALQELRECYAYYTSKISAKPVTYISTLTALSEAYIYTKKLDSASFINQLGYESCSDLNLKKLQYYFTLNEGVNLYYKDHYKPALDSLSLSIIKLRNNKDKANLSMAYFYYGKTLMALGREQEAIDAHIKVDNIFKDILEIMPNNRENYEILINYFKKNGKTNKQLYYIEQLMKVDSILNVNYKYLSKKMVLHYDTPKLLLEKQDIIDTLETQQQKSHTYILILGFLSLIMCALWVINKERQNKFKHRFEKILNEQTTNPKTLKNVTSNEENEALNIPEESIKDIRNKLLVFEKELGFLECDLSIGILAKKLGTNTKYLSKIINTYQQKTYNHYVNNLRIDYAIRRLKEDAKFRKYTIKAIAKEVGFKTTDAFSKAFYKKNGIHPSYFIRTFEKEFD